MRHGGREIYLAPKKMIMNILLLLSHVIDTANNLKKEVGNINLKTLPLHQVVYSNDNVVSMIDILFYTLKETVYIL